MASSAIQRSQSNGPGWIRSAFDGIQLSLDLINEKRIKVVVNGGAMNPKGLAEEIHEMVNIPVCLAHLHIFYLLLTCKARSISKDSSFV